MVLVIDRPHMSEPGDDKMKRWRFWDIFRRPAITHADEPLRAVLAKNDDRLLADAGLTREELAGPAEHFWQGWRRIREPWML